MAALLSSHTCTRSSRSSSIILLTWGSDPFCSHPRGEPRAPWSALSTKHLCCWRSHPVQSGVRQGKTKGMTTTGKERLLVPALRGDFNKPSVSVIKSTLCLKPGISLNMCVGLGHSDQDNWWLDPPFTIWAQSRWVCTMVSVPGWLIWLLDSCVKTTWHWHMPYY